MEIFRFDRDERVIGAHGSIGLHASRIASGDGDVTLTCLALRPGGTIGTHPTTGDQLFLVIAGSGWVAGADGIRHPVQAGQGARWGCGRGSHLRHQHQPHRSRGGGIQPAAF
jgi:hypothetical protein